MSARADVCARLERSRGMARVQRAVFLANARADLRHVALATAVVEVKKGGRALGNCHEH